MPLIQANPSVVNLDIPYRQFIPQNIPERQPGLMDILAQSAGQGVGQGINTGIANAMEKAALQKAIGMIPQGGGLLEQLNALAQMDPQSRQFIAQNYFQPQALAQSEAIKRQHELQKIDLQNQGKLQTAQAKKKEIGTFASPEQKSRVQGSFNRAAELLKKGNLGIRSPTQLLGLNRQAVEDRAEFNSLMGSLESILKDMVSKGTMSNARFNYMINLLPKDTDSDRAIKGKLKAVAQEIGLDSSQLPEYGKKSQPSFRKNQVIKNPQTGELAVWNGTRYQPYEGSYESNP